MTMGIVEVAVGGGVAAIGALGGYIALVIRPLEKDLAAEQAARAKEAEVFNKRLDALRDDKRDLEKRLSEVEKTMLTRSELDAVRRDMEHAVEKMGDRVMEHFDKATERLEARIEKIEASAR